MNFKMHFNETNGDFNVNFAEQNGNGNDGFSPIVEVEEIEGGNRVTITDKDGAKVFDVMDGRDGRDGENGKDGGYYEPEVFQLAEDTMLMSFFPENISGEHTGKDYTITLPHGEDGYTPKKGVDYWTQNDKEEIVDEVLSSIPVYNGEVEE